MDSILHFYHEHRNWIKASMIIFIIGLAAMFFYKKTSELVQDTKEFIKPIQSK